MKPVYWIIIVIVVVAGVVLFNRSSKSSTNSSPAASSQAAGSTQSQSALTVNYSDAGFSPQELKIKSGQTVAFTNQTAGPMWVASDPHPIHNGLPGFDALRGLVPGESYQFTFVKKGSFGYHDHLNPSQTGKIIVE